MTAIKLGQLAKVYRLGKTDYAITKPSTAYTVYRLVRGSWQVLGSMPTFVEAKMLIFNQAVIEKGSINI